MTDSRLSGYFTDGSFANIGLHQLEHWGCQHCDCLEEGTGCAHRHVGVRLGPQGGAGLQRLEGHPEERVLGDGVGAHLHLLIRHARHSSTHHRHQPHRLLHACADISSGTPCSHLQVVVARLERTLSGVVSFMEFEEWGILT